MLLLGALVLQVIIGGAEACRTDLDCSLNGICSGWSWLKWQSGTCVCDLPWGGSSCEVLQILPVKFPQGYGMNPNATTWGGAALLDEAAGNYHIFVSRMTNQCPLNKWWTNSRIDHAVSPTISGPYEFVDVAVNTFSHNPAPIRLPDGSYAIVHIGGGDGLPDGGANCSGARVDGDGGAGGADSRWRSSEASTIHVAATLAGPWRPLTPNTLPDCNNPAPWVHPDGTIFVLCNEDKTDKLLRSSKGIAGPWEHFATIFTHWVGGPAGNYEDPFLYTDRRGNWHIIYHVYNVNEDKESCVKSTVSAHLFSRDGRTWKSHRTQPYTTQVPLSDGSTMAVSTRERPKLFFDSKGRMTHLFNGVCSAHACPPPLGPKTGCVDCKYDNWDFTLVVPLAVAEETAIAV